jgi:hypothetical protein
MLLGGNAIIQVFLLKSKGTHTSKMKWFKSLNDWYQVQGVQQLLMKAIIRREKGAPI